MSQNNYNPPQSENRYDPLPDVHSVPRKPNARSCFLYFNFLRIVSVLIPLLSILFIGLIFVKLIPHLWLASDDSPPGYEYFDGTQFSYKVTITPVSFEEAEKSCESVGSRLASIHSQSENDFLVKLYNETLRESRTRGDVKLERPDVWIGYHYLNGKWQWIDGSPVDYENWAEGEPNLLERKDLSTVMVLEKISRNYPSGDKWSNINKENARGFICKRPSKRHNVVETTRTTPTVPATSTTSPITTTSVPTTSTTTSVPTTSTTSPITTTSVPTTSTNSPITTTSVPTTSTTSPITTTSVPTTSTTSPITTTSVPTTSTTTSVPTTSTTSPITTTSVPTTSTTTSVPTTSTTSPITTTSVPTTSTTTSVPTTSTTSPITTTSVPTTSTTTSVPTTSTTSPITTTSVPTTSTTTSVPTTSTTSPITTTSVPTTSTTSPITTTSVPTTSTTSPITTATAPKSSQSSEFSVSPKLATVVYSNEIPVNSQINQVPNPQYNGKYTIRVVLFDERFPTGDVLKKFKVFDDGVYKTTVYDIYQTNHNGGLEGSNFVISNSNTDSIDGFALLISPVYGFQSSVSINPSHMIYIPQSYSSGTDDPTVYHEIPIEVFYQSLPTVLTNVSFVGNGEVRIYAGCVTDEDVPRSIAVINADNFKNFENLRIHGRCRTYSVSNGVFQYSKRNDYPVDSHKQIGQQGVIMSKTYPYPSITADDREQHYFIFGPNAFPHFSVDYEIVHIAKDVQVRLEMGIRGDINVVNKTLTAADSGTFQANNTNTQHFRYMVPANSEGILIRYTVRQASGCETGCGCR